MSMAAGEYVSVSSQADAEKAALAQEQAELEANFQAEHIELAMIYVGRGLDLALAKQVAEQLMNHDALGAHALDELGISAIATARPLQAAFVSALSFSAGAILPLFVAFITKSEWAIVAIFLSALFSLAGLGAIAAKMGGAPVVPSAMRITFWSVLAMGVSSAVGALFGATFS
jgi:VIT1/CCC1 family predicted Fe2+/Mn2+ transporter